MDELKFEDRYKRTITSYILGRDGNAFVLGSYDSAKAALLQAYEEMRISKGEYESHKIELQSAKDAFETEATRLGDILDSRVVRNSRRGLDGLAKALRGLEGEELGVIETKYPEIKTTISGSLGPFPNLSLTRKERNLIEKPLWYARAQVKYRKSLKAYIGENGKLPEQNTKELPSWYHTALESYKNQLEDSA